MASQLANASFSRASRCKKCACASFQTVSRVNLGREFNTSVPSRQHCSDLSEASFCRLLNPDLDAFHSLKLALHIARILEASNEGRSVARGDRQRSSKFNVE